MEIIMKTAKARKCVSQNRNATLRTREDRTGKFRTETVGRDATTFTAAASTNPKTDATQLFVDFPHNGEAIRFTGREARTLYRLLQKHYRETSKSW